MTRRSKTDLTIALSKDYWNGYVRTRARSKLTLKDKVRYWKLYAPYPILQRLQEEMLGLPTIREHSKGAYIKLTNLPQPDWQSEDFLRGFMDGCAEVHRSSELVLSHGDLRQWLASVEELTDLPMPRGVAITTHKIRAYLNQRTTQKVLKHLYGVPKIGAHWKLYKNPLAD